MLASHAASFDGAITAAFVLLPACETHPRLTNVPAREIISADTNWR